jgi:tripartite ATP-independent transporter DctP family solute receptor
MFFKHNPWLFLRVVVVGVIITMVLALPMEAAPAKVTLKFAHEDNIFSHCQMQAEMFKELVEKRSNGSIEVVIYPGGTLTSSPEELLDCLRAGTVDISLTAGGNVSGYLDDLQFINLPFLFNSYEHLTVGLQSSPIRQIMDKFEKQVGVRVVALTEDGTGTCITSKKPIRSFEDMKGLKIRCMMNPIFIDMYKAFGAEPTPIDWGELYTSLQLGAVQAQDNCPNLSYAHHFFEVQDAVAMTMHYWSPFLFLVSNQAFEKLTPEQQEILITTAKETSALQVEWNHIQDERVLEILKKEGKTVTYPDREPFRKAAQSVLKTWFKKYPHWEQWYEEIQYLDPATAQPKAGLTGSK